MTDVTDPVHFEILPMGDRALLIETSDLDSVLAIDAALRPLLRPSSPLGAWRFHAQAEISTHPTEGAAAGTVTDLVPAARTVLVVARAGADLGALRRTITDSLDGIPAVAPESVGREIEIVVRYDGVDLDDVATHLGVSVAQVIEAHTSGRWRVAFTGFAPGFGYLVSADADRDSEHPDSQALAVPRRASPRTSVPAGSVALAGEYCGIYPRSSPGGWQLIGTTDAVLWDEHRDPPALLAPGTLVRFADASAPAERSA